MKPISILAIIGIVLGVMLIVFSLLSRKSLPDWGRMLFPLIGVMIMVSGVLMYLGASSLS